MLTNHVDDKSKSNPLAASTRIEAKTASTLSGQIRHDLRRGPQPAYVDAKRSHLNRVLIKNAPIPKMRAICAARRNLRDTKRGIKSNAAIATAGIISFGAEAAKMFNTLSIADQDKAFKILTRLVARRLATTVHGLCVHVDEATIHAHYQLAAVNKFGDPVSKSTSPKVMSELQDLTATVMQKFCPGIERGYRYGDRLAAGADFADTIHKSVRELHQTLPADLEAKRASLAALAADEVAAQARVDEMQDRVSKLHEKAQLSDKELKRLSTYEKRLADRIQELEAAQTVAEATRIDAERLADLARTHRQSEEVHAETVRAKAAVVGTALTALTSELKAGTIRRNASGNLTAKSQAVIRAGYPEIAPAVNAAADFVMSMDAAKASIAIDREALRVGQRELQQRRMDLRAAFQEVQILREKLLRAFSRAVRFLKKAEISAEIRDEGTVLIKEISPLLSSSEEPRDDARPGF